VTAFHSECPRLSFGVWQAWWLSTVWLASGIFAGTGMGVSARALGPPYSPERRADRDAIATP